MSLCEKDYEATQNKVCNKGLFSVIQKRKSLYGKKASRTPLTKGFLGKVLSGKGFHEFFMLSIFYFCFIFKYLGVFEGASSNFGRTYPVESAFSS